MRQFAHKVTYKLIPLAVLLAASSFGHTPPELEKAQKLVKLQENYINLLHEYLTIKQQLIETERKLKQAGKLLEAAQQEDKSLNELDLELENGNTRKR